MRYLHTMVGCKTLRDCLASTATSLGLLKHGARRRQRRFTLVFLAAGKDADSARASGSPELELTYNWDTEDYDYGRNFGHLAYKVDNIYEICQRLMEAGVTINRPPRDGHYGLRQITGQHLDRLVAGWRCAAARQKPWASMKIPAAGNGKGKSRNQNGRGADAGHSSGTYGDDNYGVLLHCHKSGETAMVDAGDAMLARRRCQNHWSLTDLDHPSSW